MPPARTKNANVSAKPTAIEIHPNDKLLIRIKSVFSEAQHVPKPRLSENMLLEDRRREMAKYEECVADYIAQLRRQFDKARTKEDVRRFCETFWVAAQVPLSVWNSNKFVDNLLEFIILSAFLLRAPNNDFEELKEVRQIAEQEDEAGPLLRKLFRQATACTRCTARGVRLRCVQMCALMLREMRMRGVSMPSEHQLRMARTLIKRSVDKIPRIRVEAMRTIHYLQYFDYEDGDVRREGGNADAENESCQASRNILYVMGTDKAAEVRVAALNALDVRMCERNNLKAVVELIKRTRDVSDRVRREAFRVISQKISARALTRNDRIKILSDGLTDECQSVRALVATTLLREWQASLLRGRESAINKGTTDPFKEAGLSKNSECALLLLQRLEVSKGEANEKTAKLAVRAIIDGTVRMKSLEDAVKEFDLLTAGRVLRGSLQRSPEAAFYWRVLCEYIFEATAGDEAKGISEDVATREKLLDQLLPPLRSLCEFAEASVQPILDGTVREEEAELREREAAAARAERRKARPRELYREMCYIAEQILKLLPLCARARARDAHAIALYENRIKELMSEETCPLGWYDVLIAQLEELMRESIVARDALEQNDKRTIDEQTADAISMFMVSEVISTRIPEEVFDAAKIEDNDDDVEEITGQMGQQTLAERRLTHERQSRARYVQRLHAVDEDVLIGALRITCALLRQACITKLTTPLRELFQRQTHALMRHKSSRVREHAFRALSLFAIIDYDIAHDLCPYLRVAMLGEADSRLRVIALQALCDLHLLYYRKFPQHYAQMVATVKANQEAETMRDPNETTYSLEEVSTQDNSQEPLPSDEAIFVRELLQLIDEDDQSISEVAVESLAKLFANGHCRSKNAKAQELYYEAFARITLEWFGDESRANRSALKHACLARALPYYASQSLCVVLSNVKSSTLKSYRSARVHIASSMMKALRMSLQAEADKVYSSQVIDVQRVGVFLLSLCEPKERTVKEDEKTENDERNISNEDAEQEQPRSSIPAAEYWPHMICAAAIAKDLMHSAQREYGGVDTPILRMLARLLERCQLPPLGIVPQQSRLRVSRELSALKEDCIQAQRICEDAKVVRSALEKVLQRIEQRMDATVDDDGDEDDEDEEDIVLQEDATTRLGRIHEEVLTEVKEESIDGEPSEIGNSPAPTVDVDEKPNDERENAPLPNAKRARIGEPALPLRESNVTQRRVTRASRRAQQ